MARYTVITYEVYVVGKGWYGQTIATTYTLPKNIEPIRDAIEQWLCTNSGDFQSISDFGASIDDIEIPFETEEGECIWHNCMFPDCTFSMHESE